MGKLSDYRRRQEKFRYQLPEPWLGPIKTGYIEGVKTVKGDYFIPPSFSSSPPIPPEKIPEIMARQELLHQKKEKRHWWSKKPKDL